MQMVHWCVCQICGRTTETKHAQNNGWIVGEWRSNKTRYIRCPQHWSEWSLRKSGLGRTKNHRAIMARHSTPGEVQMVPFYEPFPHEDKPLDD